MHISFDDNKLNRTGNKGVNEIMRFENEGLNSDDSENTDWIPNSDDTLNSNYIEYYDQSSNKNTTIEGEQ